MCNYCSHVNMRFTSERDGQLVWPDMCHRVVIALGFLRWISAHLIIGIWTAKKEQHSSISLKILTKPAKSLSISSCNAVKGSGSSQQGRRRHENITTPTRPSKTTKAKTTNRPKKPQQQGNNAIISINMKKCSQAIEAKRPASNCQVRSGSL